MFGRFTYRSTTPGRQVTSPLAVYAHVVDGRRRNGTAVMRGSPPPGPLCATESYGKAQSVQEVGREAKVDRLEIAGV
jgi:hypothetical protein